MDERSKHYISGVPVINVQCPMIEFFNRNGSVADMDELTSTNISSQISQSERSGDSQSQIARRVSVAKQMSADLDGGRYKCRLDVSANGITPSEARTSFLATTRYFFSP